MTKSRTVLADFQRQVREEPLWYIYDHKIFLLAEKVKADEVTAWLQKRYVQSKKGNRYRVTTYLHQDGERYVDHILLESVTDNDLMYVKLRWGWSREPVKRTGKSVRKRLTKAQRAQLDALINAVTERFYASL